MWKFVTRRLDSSDSYVSMALGLAAVLLVGMIVFNRFAAKLGSRPGTTDVTGTPSASVPLPTAHQVKDGETLWAIAETYYKSGYNWVDIARENVIVDPDYITVDQKLTIPKAEPIVVKESGDLASGVTARKADHDRVTVVTGDTLWAIAEREYGDAYRWPEIARNNALANPDIIHPGQVLTMP